MDLSKLPKLSQTHTPPNDGDAASADAHAAQPRSDYGGPSTPVYRPEGEGLYTAMDVFLSVGVGLLFIFLGLNYGKYLMGSTTAYPPITGTGIVWSPGHPKAGQEVPPEELSAENKKAYDDQIVGRAMGIVSESSLFLFGVASIAAGLLGVVGHLGAVPLVARRGAMWLGVVVTGLALAYALYAAVALLGHGITPIMTLLALIVGGMTLFFQAAAARALGGGGFVVGGIPGGAVATTTYPYYGTAARPTASPSSPVRSAGSAPVGRAPAMSPARLVHHRFAHQVLRQHVLGSPAQAVGALQGPGGRRLLLELWDATCRVVGARSDGPAPDAATPDGLEAEMTQVGPYSAAVVTMPPAVGEGEASFVGVVFRSYVRQDGAVIERQPLVLYYTLEVGKGGVGGPATDGNPAAGTAPPTVLCEWNGPDHVRFADVVPAEFGAFREAMRLKVQARQEAEDRAVGSA